MLRKIFHTTISCCLACMFFLVGCDNSSVEEPSAPINVTKIVLSDKDVQLLAGDNYEITATTYNEEQKLDEKVTWSSSNPSVAIVNNGKIIALSGGTATITATYGDLSEKINVFVAKRITATNVNSFDEEYINIYGRSYIEDGKLNLDHCANGVELAIIGSSLSVDITSTVDNSYLRVYVDNDAEGNRMKIAKGTNTYTVAENLTNGYHKIRLVKATEMLHSSWDISNFVAPSFATLPEKSDLKIEIIGDSITAGNANLGSSGDEWSVDNSDSAKTYAYFAAQQLNADYSIVAMSGICVKAYHWVKNTNMATLYTYVSNTNTTTYDYSFKPDVIVLNLGTNDANYMTKPEGANYGSQFPNDYRAYLSYLREKNPNAYIICLYGMMGKNLAVDANIQAIVDSSNDAKLVYNPFEFEPNTLGGAYHPSLSAQKTWGESLANYIQGLKIN